MARNSEKAKSMLNRWIAMKRGFRTRPRRMYEPSTVNRVSHCERNRRTTIKSIIRKVAIIQNVSLGEHKIRELNEDINNLLEQKRKWEERMVELNGPDYRKESSMFDEDGDDIVKINGILYFGAAKLLPSVQEVINERKKRKKKKRTREEFLELVDIEYYGYVEDLDHIEEMEKKLEKRERGKEIEKWNEFSKKENRLEIESFEDLDMGKVNIPTQEDIRFSILEKRKGEMMKKYF